MASSWATTGPMTSLLASWLSWALERFLYAEADLLARWQLHDWLDCPAADCESPDVAAG